MKRRILLISMVLTVIFASSIPAFAITDVDQPDFNQGMLSEAVTSLTSDVIEITICTVTFDSAGGSPVASQYPPKGGWAIEPSDPVRDGFTFTGWYHGSALFDFYETRVNEDITLTAHWSSIITDPIVLVSIDPFAKIEKLNGNKNSLTITIVGKYSNGGTKVFAENTFLISNNSSDTYRVGVYNVYVATKGNDQVRECYIKWSNIT